MNRLAICCIAVLAVSAIARADKPADAKYSHAGDRYSKPGIVFDDKTEAKLASESDWRTIKEWSDSALNSRAGVNLAAGSEVLLAIAEKHGSEDQRLSDDEQAAIRDCARELMEKCDHDDIWTPVRLLNAVRMARYVGDASLRAPLLKLAVITGKGRSIADVKTPSEPYTVGFMLRESAMQSLSEGRLLNESCILPLAKAAITDPQWTNRAHAARLIAKIGGPKARAELEKLAKQKQQHEVSEAINLALDKLDRAESTKH